MLARRFRQFGEFLRPARLPSLEPHPFPWRHPETLRYYVSYELDDPDGHGGYTRLYQFDDRGLPYTSGPHGALYDPLVVARYGIRMLAIAGACANPAAAGRARAVLEPLLTSVEATGSWGRAGRADQMSTDRPSAIVQGVGLSALVRLAGRAPLPRVRAAVERALDRLVTPVEEGGTCSRLEGGPFLEEYPSQPPSHVLNGGLYALFGLYDLEDGLAHEKAGTLAREIERTLVRALHRFDAHMGWSRYALHLHGHALLASAHYHRLHVTGLRVLQARTGHEAFGRWAARWERALRSPWRRTPMALLKVLETVYERRAFGG
jgi:hypothetical protein